MKCYEVKRPDGTIIAYLDAKEAGDCKEPHPGKEADKPSKGAVLSLRYKHAAAKEKAEK